jgi:hypothetical protein
MVPELPIEPVPDALVSWPLPVEPVPIEPVAPGAVPVVPIEPVAPVAPVVPVVPLPWAVVEPEVSLGGVAAEPVVPVLAVPLGAVAVPCAPAAPPAVPWVPSADVDDVRPVSLPAVRVSLLPLAQATSAAATSAIPPKVIFISTSLGMSRRPAPLWGASHACRISRLPARCRHRRDEVEAWTGGGPVGEKTC